jgi:hypothetical protein
MDKELIKAIARKDFEHSIEDDFEDTTVYKIQGDENYILFWNSSNGEEPEFRYVLPEMIQNIVDEKTEGNIFDGYNEIMFKTFNI